MRASSIAMLRPGVNLYRPMPWPCSANLVFEGRRANTLLNAKYKVGYSSHASRPAPLLESHLLVAMPTVVGIMCSSDIGVAVAFERHFNSSNIFWLVG